MLFTKELSSINTRGSNGKVFKKKKKLPQRGVCVYNNLSSNSSASFEQVPNVGLNSTYEYLQTKKSPTRRTPEKKDNFEDDLIKLDELQKAPKLQLALNVRPKSDQEEKTASSDDDTSVADDTFSENSASNKNILQAIQEQNASKIGLITEKYKDAKIPPHIQSKAALYERIERHIHIIPQILNAKMYPSEYYVLARSQQKLSPHEIMSSDEKWTIDWKQYHGGYYGLKRQSIIGNYINTKFRELLLQKSAKNKTIVYWTTSGFSTYVLANEIIIRMVMEDIGCSEEEAVLKAQSTTEYGTIVADSVDVIDDLDMPQPETKNSEQKQKQKVKKTKRKHKKISVLDQLLE